MPYTPGKVTAIDTSGDVGKLGDSVVDLTGFLENELGAISSAMQDPIQAGVEYVVPVKPRLGQVVYADGVHWNPGNGEGLYAYGSDAAWHWLEASDQLANVVALQAKTTGYESAWVAYTPTITASSGTFTTTSATGRYKQIGKTIFVNIEITITTVGTASGQLRATLPVAPNTTQTRYQLTGRENVLTAKMVSGSILTSTGICSIVNYDNTSVIAATAQVTLTGVYEAA